MKSLAIALMLLTGDEMTVYEFPDGSQLVQVRTTIHDAVPDAVSAVPDAASLGRRRAARSGPPAPLLPEPETLVHVGDVATFSGSHGVSGVATIVANNAIRVTNMRHDGSAPGLDIRIGLSSVPRKKFTVLLTPGRQAYNNATIDLMLPPSVDLNSFDTFTVWCYEFSVVIAEGRFRRP